MIKSFSITLLYYIVVLLMICTYPIWIVMMLFMLPLKSIINLEAKIRKMTDEDDRRF